MKNYFLYEPLTFEYLGDYLAQESPLEPGQYIAPEHSSPKQPLAPVDGMAICFNPESDDWEHKVDHRGTWYKPNGEAVEVTDLNLVPDPSWTLDHPATDPEIVKANQWTAIKFMREQIKAGGVLATGKWFHSDADSRIQHLGLKDSARDVLAAGGAMADRLKIAGQDIPWKTMDGSFVLMTAQIAFDIVAAVALLDAMAHIKAEQHKGAMEASADPASYDYSTGWPAVFGGV